MSTDSSSDQSPSLLRVAFTARCPRCGEGKLYDGYLTVAKSCSVCGLGLAGHDTGDGPAFFIMLPLCIIVAVLALLTDINFRPPMWVHMTLWPLAIIGAVTLTLRPVKAVMIALQYRHRDVEHIDKSGQQ
ncbi:MAG: DUF983 domain-containing protein [Alphaproteobacteria bacterium]|nr:DUF983 domain-containing protein [Alphaproteobacteria bacterium]